MWKNGKITVAVSQKVEIELYYLIIEQFYFETYTQRIESRESDICVAMVVTTLL